jgi:hypothetical protein
MYQILGANGVLDFSEVCRHILRLIIHRKAGVQGIKRGSAYAALSRENSVTEMWVQGKSRELKIGGILPDPF